MLRFRLSTVPCIGIRASQSQDSRVSRRKPAPSAPITQASGRFRSSVYRLSLASPARLTRYNAIAQVTVALAATIGASMGGLMISAWGYRTVFALSGAGRLLSMIFFWRFVKAPALQTPEPVALPLPE